MKFVYTILTLAVIGLICFAVRGMIQEKSSHQSTLPQVARAYTLYSSDTQMDIHSSPRRYTVVEIRSDWVQMSCKETVGPFSMIVGNTFTGHLGFNPETLIGRWTGEEGSDYQQAIVQLTKDGYGGYGIKFLYQTTKNVREARLAPVL